MTTATLMVLALVSQQTPRQEAAAAALNANGIYLTVLDWDVESVMPVREIIIGYENDITLGQRVLIEGREFYYFLAIFQATTGHQEYLDHLQPVAAGQAAYGDGEAKYSEGIQLQANGLQEDADMAFGEATMFYDEAATEYQTAISHLAAALQWYLLAKPNYEISTVRDTL